MYVDKSRTKKKQVIYHAAANEHYKKLIANILKLTTIHSCSDEIWEMENNKLIRVNRFHSIPLFCELLQESPTSGSYVKYAAAGQIPAGTQVFGPVYKDIHDLGAKPARDGTQTVIANSNLKPREISTKPLPKRDYGCKKICPK